MARSRVVLSKLAARDIDNVSDYTIERWGREQARNYVAAIRADIESLNEFALRHPVHQSRHGELRKMASGHHLVFYEVSDEIVEIVRILHERMDRNEQFD